MITQKAGSVSIHYLQGKKVPAGIANAVCIPFDFSGHCMQCLRSNNSCPGCPGAEESALAYAVFEAIHRSLTGTPVKLGKSKASGIDCSVNNHFVVYWTTPSQFGVCRRDVLLVLKAITPEKLFQGYVDNCRLINADKSRDQFNRVVGKFHAAMKDIDVYMVGKANIDSKKLGDIADKVKGISFPSGKPSPAASKAPEHKLDKSKMSEKEKKDMEKEEKSKYCVPDKSIAAPLLVSYINMKGSGIQADLVDSHVVVYSPVAKTKLMSLSDKNKIADFAKNGFGKLDDELPAVLAYFMITNGTADCHSLKAVKNIKEKDISSELSKILAKVK